MGLPGLPLGVPAGRRGGDGDGGVMGTSEGGAGAGRLVRGGALAGDADVPVVQREAVRDAWDQFRWLWDVLFAVAYVATTVLVLLDDGKPPSRTVAVLALAGIAAAYLVKGRRIIGDDDRT